MKEERQRETVSEKRNEDLELKVKVVTKEIHFEN